jgi:hypothetical protein
MNVKRSLIIAGLAAALAVWIAAAATSGGHEPAPIAIAPAPIDTRGKALAVEVARLRDRLRPTTAPRLERNLFRFSAVQSQALGASSSKPVALPVTGPAAPATDAPPLRLVGIAEDGDPPVRTAIISAAGQLLLVKAGDEATAAYRVVDVQADGVELADTTTGSALRLPLK